MKYIRPKPFASTFFKVNGGPGTIFGAIPRYKFMYYANFVASDGALARFPELKTLGNWETGVSFKITGISKPNIDLDFQELNQYNRKRYAYKKVNYHPFTVKMYDTVDNIPLKLWHKYFSYYFGDSDGVSSNKYNATQQIYDAGVTDSTLSYSPGWGFTPVAEATNFFNRVELYAFYAGYYTQINYIKPKITRIDWKDYESSESGPAEVDMTLAYEAVEYIINEKITEDQANQFGFKIATTLEVPGVPVPDKNVANWRSNANIYGIFDKLANGIGITPNDILQGISSTFTIANTTLNMFNQLPIAAFSPSLAKTIGQTNQQLTYAHTDLALVTNPYVSTQFLGTGYSYAQQTAGVLGQFGLFNFGR